MVDAVSVSLNYRGLFGPDPKRSGSPEHVTEPHPSAHRDLENFGITEIIVSKCLIGLGPKTPPHHMFSSPFCPIQKNSGIENVKLSC